MVRRVLQWLGVAALVVAAVVTAGWGSGPTPPPAEVSPPAVPSAAPTSLSAAEAGSVVRSSALKGADLPPGFTRVTNGVRVGVPSLDLCGSSVDSERHRLAVNRVAFRAPGDRGLVRHVLVAYESGYVERVLADLEAAAPRCTRPVKPSSSQQPDLLVLRLRATGRSGVVRHDLLVERRGDVLALLEVDARQGHLTLPLARRLGNRLQRHA